MLDLFEKKIMQSFTQDGSRLSKGSQKYQFVNNSKM